MKRLLSLFVCALLMVSSITPAFAAKANDLQITAAQPSEPTADAVQAEDVEPLDSIVQYFEENTTVIDHGNGVVEYTLTPAAAHITVAELTDTADVVTASEPIYGAASTPDYGYTTGQTHTPITLEQKYLYSLLSAEDKEMYRTIYNSVKNLEAESAFGISMSDTGKYQLYYAVMFDNPEFFYLGNTVTIMNNGDGTSGLSYCYAASRDEYCRYGHTPSKITPELKAKILAKKAIFDNRVQSIVSTIPANAPEVVKERLIYVRILLDSHYNLGAQWNGICEDNWNAYGILCNGYGVCESYSEAFQTVCHAVGIECTGVVGDAGGGHKWNAVKIEGEWYQCDITFDDPIGNAPEDAYCHYFNLTDAEMGKNHTWGYENEFPVPACTATKNGRENFLARYSVSSGWGDWHLHYFDNKCDTTCNNCDATRDAGKHEFNGKFCKHCGYRMREGWKFEDNNWYYYRNDERVCKEWVSDSGGPCYLGYDGALVTESSVYDDKGEEVCYVDKSGHVLKNAWRESYGSWFFLDKNGKRLKSSWLLWKGEWYHFNEYGWMETNVWKKDSHGWCYLKSNGKMAKNQWIEWNGGWYFLNADGYMLANVWKKDSKGWVYLGDNGRMKTNAWVRDSVGWCHVGWDGYCETNTWRQDSKGWCYLGSDGRMLVSRWLEINGVWYYLDAGGHRVYGRYKIGNKYYQFHNEWGYWLGY